MMTDEMERRLQQTVPRWVGFMGIVAAALAVTLAAGTFFHEVSTRLDLVPQIARDIREIRDTQSALAAQLAKNRFQIDSLKIELAHDGARPCRRTP